MVTDNRWKYVWNNGDVDELFDLAEDPHEVENVIDNPKHASELTRLQSRLFEWMLETKDPILKPF